MIEQYEKELLQYLRDKSFYHEAYISNGNLYINIQWGDWKHDHWYADVLIEDFFKDKDEVREIFYGINVTEEDGSDCYSATHIYKIIMK